MGGVVRAIGAINGGKEWVVATSAKELVLDAANAEPHGIATEVAGAAGAAVGSDTLEEGIVAALINRAAVGGVSSDDSGGIEKMK